MPNAQTDCFPTIRFTRVDRETWRIRSLTVFMLLVLTSVSWAEPKVHDDRLQLTKFAEAPQIVTPIGIAVDESGRLFVIESHTHNPPPGYRGPKSDRIIRMVDRDGDGKCDSLSVFAEGLNAAMNLAFAPDGTLYVVCARSLYALPDNDHDGRCDELRKILTLETDERYPHNSWLSLCFSDDGWMWVGRGNTGSRAHTVRGADGTTVSGYGDGGDIIRCRPDGTQLTRFATGFWNPFDIKMDCDGRLLCVDNDPDARGPNRLVHVVRGGDYGYQSLYGGAGNHPYQGWDGDLPGVLPLVSGTGEAPSGIIDSRRVGWPTDGRGSYFVTIWNENTIESHTPTPAGLSIKAEREVLVSGGRDFRPVALATNGRGDLYFTDWVLVDYPNHGRGCIWRLSSRGGEHEAQLTRSPATADLKQADDDGSKAVWRRLLRGADDVLSSATPNMIENGLLSDDPFERHAATIALQHSPELQRLAQQWRAASDARLRLGALLAIKRRHEGDANVRVSELLYAKEFLSDSDPLVCRAALQWVGERRMVALRSDVEAVLHQPMLTGPLFEVYLATIRNLSPEFDAAYRKRAKSRASQTLPPLDPGIARSIAANDALSATVRSLAVANIGTAEVHEARAQLVGFLAPSYDDAIRVAAVRKMMEFPHRDFRSALSLLVRDSNASDLLRSFAMLALSHDPSTRAESILPQLIDGNSVLAVEAARTLRHLDLSSAMVKSMRERWAKANESEDVTEQRIAAQLASVLGESEPGRPKNLAEWLKWLGDDGEPSRGERVFYSQHAGCNKCHTINGRGGALGPDLSQVAVSSTRSQVIRSILRPSENFAPQHQAWQVITNDGTVHAGIQLDHKANGAIELMTLDGKTRRFDGRSIDEYFASRNSIMPSGLEQAMTKFELRDLVSFLCQLR